MSQSLLILLIIGVYFCVLMLISRLTSRGAGNSTFFIGNRKMPWPVVALAMITAPISGVTFVSVPGMVMTKGYSYLQMCLGFIVGYLVIAAVLVPLYYKHGIVSIYSFLETRFGKEAYKTGAWFFLISKTLSTAVKFLVVCMSLQLLVFDLLHIPFILNVIFTLTLIGLYTFRGGVKTVIWADIFKSLCLVGSVVVSIYLILGVLDLSVTDFIGNISHRSDSRIFFFDNPSEATYFWKQFLGGVFLVVAMTGLDQDMMQHTLSCKNTGSSKKNLYLSAVLQFVVIAMFLSLGSLLLIYNEWNSMALPGNSDDMFSLTAFHKGMPKMVGILFVIGLISASYSSVGSALTSLTTSYTIDVLEGRKKYEEQKLKRVRNLTHFGFSAVLVLLICGFYYLNNQDAITAVFTLASYTYGPILGLFVYGILSKKRVNPRLVAVICFFSPLLSWVIQWAALEYFGYQVGFELLLINAALIIIGIGLLPTLEKEESKEMIAGV